MKRALDPAPAGETTSAARRPTFAEALRFWAKLGFISFGGPSGQIAIMHAEVVERRRWIGEAQFLHALNYCMLLPGPEAQQLATYIGWLLHRTWGGIVAGALFVLPSAVILWAMSWAYALHGETTWVVAVFDGLKPAVLAIVGAAVWRIGTRALKSGGLWTLAAAAFAGLFFFHVPFPAVVLGAGAAGWIGGGFAGGRFIPAMTAPGRRGAGAVHDVETGASARPSLGRALRVGAACLALWWAPVIALAVWLGSDHVLVRQGLFFSKAALVTFGGAYAVLPYVSQQAVEAYGWLDAGQMLDGLGLAETTPGPLIMVLQFVGFLGAWKLHDPFSPLVAATFGACITTWTTFLPSFLWIFLGAPWVERLWSHTYLTAALSAITAAVVGVILNLAIWFGLHVLFPGGRAVNWFGVLIFAVALAGMTRWKWNVVPVVLGAGAAGALWRLAG
jgi:chromate transporter